MSTIEAPKTHLDQIKNLYHSSDRKTVIYALERMLPLHGEFPAEINSLIAKALKSSEKSIRIKAISMISTLELTDNFLVDALVDQLFDNFDSLGCMQPESAGNEIKQATLTAIKKLGHSLPLETLKSLLNHEADSSFISAVLPLAGKLLVEEALILLTPYLSSKEERIRANAVETLGLFVAEDEVKQLLNGMLSDPSPRVKGNILMALFPVAPADVLKKARLDLKIGTTSHRVSACYAMASMPNEEMLFLLLKSLNDRSKKVVCMALRSLSELANENLIPELLNRFIKESDSEIRQEIIKACGQIDEESLFSHIKELFLVEKDPRIRANLVMAFATLSPREEVGEFLIRFLFDSNARVRANIVEVLGSDSMITVSSKKLNSRLCEGFMKSLGDDNNRVRANAVNALWKRKSLGVISTLKHMLVQANPKMRASAAFALGEMGGIQFTDLIQDSVVDIDPMVRRSALVALSKTRGTTRVSPFSG